MNSLPDSPTTHQLLYAPFSKDYHVSKTISSKLTEEVFFRDCYVEPNFSDAEKRISEDDGYIDEADDGAQFTTELELIELKQRIHDQMTSFASFEQWIEDNGNGVYCIKGDAGTGKTTFLHHLEYTHRAGDVLWKIIDLQDAVEPVKIYAQEIKFKNFKPLQYKVISSILVAIKNLYFPLKFSTDEIVKSLEELIIQYLDNKVILFQTEEVKWFFEDSLIFLEYGKKITDSQMEEFIKDLCKKLQNLIDNYSPDVVIDRLMDVYMTILRSKNPLGKHIIAFDNIERFIGSDEIFNSQIDSFVEELRHLSDTFSSRDPFFLKRFQFVVLMRNTSSRMATVPLQLIDFGGHDLDLSDWFPVDIIISNKLKWYKGNGIRINNADLIDSIIGNDCFDGHGIRSLQEKLGSILNRDKRIVVNMLDRAVGYALAANPQIMRCYDDFVKNVRGLPPALVKFAAGSIIFRIVLDVFRQDNFFKLLRTQEHGSKLERLGYSRKILINLYEHHLQDQHVTYVPFSEMIHELFGNSYFDSNNSHLRDTISSILFTMNYYNRRTDDWFRLIDIQYNTEVGSVSISNYKELDELLCKHPEEVGFKIMEGGIGYLKYVVQSFEYFSCRYDNKYLPPLLCLVPSLSELDTKYANQFECYQVIIAAHNDAKKCIEYMSQQDAPDVPFRRRVGERGISHVQRLINSHTGYIGNFMGFVREYYKNDKTITYERRRKLDDLDELLAGMINQYKQYAD